MDANGGLVYRSLQTVGSLLLTNSDFRLFLGDLDVVAREVFKDTAFAISEASQEAGRRLGPSSAEQDSVKQPGNSSQNPPSQQELVDQTAEFSNVLSGTASTVAGEAENSAVQKLKGPEKDAMVRRLKDTVINLRQRRDYSDSVTTLSLLFKRYAMAYSRIARDTVQAVDEDVDENRETDLALRNFWAFLRSFGEESQWEELEKQTNAVMEHGREDPDLMTWWDSWATRSRICLPIRPSSTMPNTASRSSAPSLDKYPLTLLCGTT